MTARTVNPPRAIVPPAEQSKRRGRRAYRYTIVEHELFSGSRFSIRRALPDSAISEVWKGREMGWVPNDAPQIPKLYTRYGDAYRTLRQLQDRDREVSTAAGRRRALERLAPELLDALRSIAESYPTTEEGETLAAMAREAVRNADRIFNGN